MSRDIAEFVRKHAPPNEGAQVRLNHCKPGFDNRAFYVKRSGSVALYHCFHCGIKGRVNLADECYKHPRVPGGIVESRIALPSDSTSNVRAWHPSAAIHVLGYGITQDEITDFGVVFSARLGALVFPIVDRDNGLIGYQSRRFPPVEKGPKYVTKIKPESNRNFKLLKGDGKTSNKLIICEDYLSAIKSARVAAAFACFGTTLTISPADLVQFEEVYIWFDHDNRQVISKELKAFSFVRQFVPRSKIVKIGDPKRHSTETLKGELDLCL